MTGLAREDVEDIIGLTPTQWGMLVQYLKDPSGGLYHEQVCLDLEGPVDEAIFARAWDAVVAGNEMLRAVFRWEGLAKPVQVIRRWHRPELRRRDLRHEPPERRAAALARAVASDAEDPFDLREVPFRVTLFRTGEARWALLKTFHHILYDGWSTRIILGEFLAAYAALRQGDQPPPARKGRFRDHVLWLKRQEAAGADSFWKTYLADLEVRPLPAMPGLEAVRAGAQEQLRGALPPEASAGVRRLAQAYRLTSAQVIYVAWGLLLQKYTASEDCLFGTVVSGRENGGPGVDAVVGVYINAPPMRLRCRRSERLGDVLRRAGAELSERAGHVSAPLTLIQQACDLAHEGPFVDTIVTVLNFPFDELLRDAPIDFRIAGYSHRDPPVEYPLGVTVTGTTELEVHVSYQKSLFDRAAVRQLVSHFGRILAVAGERPEAPVGELLRTRTLVGEEPWRGLIARGAADEPVDAPARSLDGLFASQAERTPEATALVGPDASLTYRQLDARANQLARALRQRGVGPSSVVALCLDRSPELILCMLATLKAGGAYLPLDPEAPPEHQRAVLADARARVALVAPQFADSLAGVDVPLLPVDAALWRDGGALASQSDEALGISAGPGEAAYVIYTSGSTGRPKGVVVEHGAAAEFVQVQAREFALSPSDRVLQFGASSFDLSVEEIFVTLASGATLVLREPGPPEAASAFLASCARRGVTVLDLPTAYWHELVAGLSSGAALPDSVRLVVIGGEAASAEHVTAWKAQVHARVRLLNTYGPTEGVVVATSCDLGAHALAALGRVPIGRPLPGCHVYVLDRFGDIVPEGATGELLLGGRLARGYLGRPREAAAAFVPDPFAPGPGARMYATGDLARFRGDGQLEFCGRRDQQVKLRGFRVELGEVEGALLRHPGVHNAAVIVRDDGQGKGGDHRYLCAYVVAEPALTPEPLRAYLLETLPAHMVPSALVLLDGLPLTARGKLDRARLPAPRGEAPVETKAASPTEARLACIFSEVLGCEPETLDAEESFFDAGGHSLSAMSLLALIEKAFGKVLPVRELFRAPTIRALASLLDGAAEREGVSISPAPERPHYPVSSLQRRIFATAARLPDSSVYNMTGGVWVEGAVDVGQLAAAFDALVRRHEGLRTGFEIVDGEVVQRVHPQVEAPLQRRSLAAPSEAADAARALARPFDLARPPLARLSVLEASKDLRLLLLDVHHLVADGVAISVLVRELLGAYRGEALPPLPVQAKDHTVWMHSEAGRARLQAQAAYWAGALAERPGPLTLPTDFPRPPHARHRGGTLGFELGAARHAGLAALGREQGATLFMTSLAAFGVLLGRLSGRDDLIVGTPVSGRRHVDVQGVIGLLANMLPLRLRPAPRRSFLDLLGEVRGRVVDAFEHQELPVDDLIDALGIKADAGRHPLFDVAFAYERGDEASERALEAVDVGWRVFPYVHESGNAKFDLQLTLTEHGNDLHAALEYDADLFLPETITILRDRFLILVDAILRHPSQPIAGLDWETDFEKQLKNRSEIDFAF